MLDPRPSFGLGFLRRRAWILVAVPILGLAVAWLISGLSVSGSAAYRVKTTEDIQVPYAGARLALSYAQLIPEDPEVLAGLQGRTGLSRSFLKDRLTMSTEPETNILFARFTGNDREMTIDVLNALTESMKSAKEVAGTPLAKTVLPLSKPKINGGFSRKKALLLGFVAALLIALSIALTLERRRPRVDYVEVLAEILPVPVSLADCGRFVSAREATRTEDGATTPTYLPVLFDSDRYATVPGHSLAGAEDEDAAALVFERGSPVAEVEARWWEAVGSGRRVVTAFLVPRRRTLSAIGTRR